MAGKLKKDNGAAHQPNRGTKAKSSKNYPPFLALQLVFRDYLQDAPPYWVVDCRLVSKQFKSAVESANPPFTFYISRGSLNIELQTVIRFITSEPRWEWVTKVRLSGAGVSMTQEDCKLLVAALGARAWESINLVQVKLTHPLMLPAIIKTSAERGTLRHLSIADSPLSSAGLQSALSSLSHCLRTLELAPGITILAPSANPLVAEKCADNGFPGRLLGDTTKDTKITGQYACESVRTLVLGNTREARGAREVRKSKRPALPARLPVTMFPLEPLRTLWLVGLGGLTEDDVIGIFQRTPLLEEFRLFKSETPVQYSNHSAGVTHGTCFGSNASLTPAAVAGVFKGLTRHHCPRLARLSVRWKDYSIKFQDLHGSWLRRFADAHPRMTEVKLFVEGKLSSEDWLYALEKWAPTLEKVTGRFGEYSEDLDAERHLVVFAKAPRLTELECLGACYRDEIEWMRQVSPGVFDKLKHLGNDVRKKRKYHYAWLLERRGRWWD